MSQGTRKGLAGELVASKPEGGAEESKQYATTGNGGELYRESTESITFTAWPEVMLSSCTAQGWGVQGPPTFDYCL